MFQDQFFTFYQPYLKKIHQTIINGNVLILIGINAIGKNLLVEQVLSDRFREEFLKSDNIHLVSLNFKDKSQPTYAQIYRYWMMQTMQVLKRKIKPDKDCNDFTFYSQMSETIKNLRHDERIAFVILDAQQLLNQSETFFNSLIYLHKFSYGKVSFIILSEPHILGCKSSGVRRFVNHLTKQKYIFLRTFDKKTIFANIKRQEKLLQTDFSRHYSLITKYSRGLHGVIDAFCSILKNSPKIQNVRQLMHIVYSDELFRFWVNDVFDSLPGDSVRILKEIGLKKSFYKYRKNIYYDWLIKLGFLRQNGRSRYPLMIPLLKQYSESKLVKASKLRLIKGQFYCQGERIKLTKREYLILTALYKSKGKPISYDQIGEILWKNEEEKYSMWAIAQIVCRLKKTLSFYFINPQIISSQRGEGYTLN